MTKIDVVVHVCKISFKSVQVCGGCCKMFRGLTFLGTQCNKCPRTSNQLNLTHASLCLNTVTVHDGGSVAKWLACWTQAQKARVQIAAATLSGNSLRPTVHTHCASVHQAAKLVAALIRVARVTAGLAESNGSLPPGL